MDKIIPHLWFDQNTEEAVGFYTGFFPNSRIGRVARYGEAGAQVSGMPKGSVMTIDFQLCGQNFVAINGGPHFKFTPSVSLTVYCENREEIDALWDKLSSGGRTLMELGSYPFSECFGFLQDKYGLAWQLNLVGKKQKIVPTLLFVDEKFGRAEDAMQTYVSLFDDARVIRAERYGPGEDAPEGALKHGIFSLRGQEFIAMDGPGKHGFSFTGAISFLVDSQTQAEVDRYWSRLAQEGQEMPCGWVEDKFGVSWQVAPVALGEWMSDSDPVKTERAMKAMLTMKKIDVEKLKRAYAGEPV